MSIALMASGETKHSNASMAIAKAIIEEYQPKNAEEMHNALKDIFRPMFEAMLQREMDSIKPMIMGIKIPQTVETATSIKM